MSKGCHLTVQCQKNAKISCGKVQIAYMHKVAFLILKLVTARILKLKYHRERP